MMERQVNHMVRLVDDLLEVSRITRGKIELRKERVDLAAVLQNGRRNEPAADRGGRPPAHTGRFPPSRLTVDGDPVRLAQVIANLLNNAAKYTDAGGQIWLTVRREGGSGSHFGAGHRRSAFRARCSRASSTCSRRSTVTRDRAKAVSASA